MSDAYEDDLAAEQAIFDRIAAAEPEPEAVTEAPHDRGGRPTKVNPIKLVAWRQARNATIAATAKHWKVSLATVKRYMREYEEAAKAERRRFEIDRLEREERQHEYDLRVMFLGQRNKHRNWVALQWFRVREAARGTPSEAAVEAAYDAAFDHADREFLTSWERSMWPVPGAYRTGEKG